MSGGSNVIFGIGALFLMVGLAGTAQAQSPYEPYDWSGSYIGLEGGPATGSSKHFDSSGFTSGWFSTDGGILGVTGGHNWQDNNIVYGIEGDMSWAAIAGSTSGFYDEACGGTYPNCGSRLNDLGTARGRIGWAFGNIMPYLTAGVAFGDVKGLEGDVPANHAAGAGSAYHAGWTAGLGVEEQFMPNWSAKIEYLHADLGNGPTFTDTFADGSTAVQNVDFNTDIVRFGINYRF